MEVGGQRHAPAALQPGKTRYPLYWLDGPWGLSGRVRKISPPPPGFYPRTSHPVANRYIDWAIPAQMWMWLQPSYWWYYEIKIGCFSPCFQNRLWGPIFLTSGWSGCVVTMTKRLHLVYSMFAYVRISQPLWADTQIGPIALSRDPRGKKWRHVLKHVNGSNECAISFTVWVSVWCCDSSYGSYI
jgi:hypothetical protein